MRHLFLIACVVAGFRTGFSAPTGKNDGGDALPAQKKASPDSIVATTAKTDSVKNAGAVDSCLAIVTIDPRDGGDVNIMLVMRTKAVVFPGTMSLVTVNPDTLGTWKPPLVRYVPTGFYDILLTKQGFEDIMKRNHGFTERKDSISFSFTSLQQRRDLLGTCKWISAGIAIVATAASLYLDQKVHSDEQSYNNSVDAAEIADLRNSISRNRDLYKITTRAIIPAAAVFGILWLLQVEI